MNGRYFDGRVVQAYIADGGEKFKRTSERKLGIDEDGGNDESQRLDQFGEWLEEGSKA